MNFPEVISVYMYTNFIFVLVVYVDDRFRIIYLLKWLLKNILIDVWFIWTRYNWWLDKI